MDRLQNAHQVDAAGALDHEQLVVLARLADQSNRKVFFEDRMVLDIRQNVVEVIVLTEAQMTAEFGQSLFLVESVALGPAEQIEVGVVVVGQEVFALEVANCCLFFSGNILQ